MKALKWIGLAVLALIILISIIPFFISVDKYRPMIEEKASAALGRKVTMGKLSLSIWSGSVEINEVSIADDPKFGTKPFLTAKDVKVGVELMPLIFSKQLNVTHINIDQPQVLMLKDPSGKWNFSSIGGSSTESAAKQPEKPASSSSGGSSAEAVKIAKLELTDGQITIGNTNSQKRSVYPNVNLTASNVAMDANFPVNFSMGLPGGGTMKIDGNVGPVDKRDASFTPQNVKLTISSLDLAKMGFLDPSLGLGGVADLNSDLISKDGMFHAKGTLKLSKALLVAGGTPATVPLTLNYNNDYDLAKSQGTLTDATVGIGAAKADLKGTYKSEGDNTVVNATIAGQGMPAKDLEGFLPALGISLPKGTSLTAGTMNTNLHVMGPTNNLVTDGTIGLFNAKLAGFNLGSQFSSVAALAGIKTGNDLDIEKLTTNLHFTNSGLNVNSLQLVAPALGTVVGSGTLDAKNNLNFNAVASVNSNLLGAAGKAEGGAIGGLIAGGASCKGQGLKVPFQIHGTTTNPQFTPDVGGATANLLKAELGCGLGGMFGGGGQGGAAANPVNTIEQGLGGLLGGGGGKKKNPFPF